MLIVNPAVEKEVQEESNFKIFKSNGLVCIVLRMPLWSGAINGYVGVDKSHPSYGKDYDSVGVQVHGGLTYSREKLHCVDEEVTGPLWWFGFDTAHYMDLKPMQNEIDQKFAFNHEGDTYKNLKYVEEETRRLAEQLAKQQQ